MGGSGESDLRRAGFRVREMHLEVDKLGSDSEAKPEESPQVAASFTPPAVAPLLSHVWRAAVKERSCVESSDVYA